MYRLRGSIIRAHSSRQVHKSRYVVVMPRREFAFNATSMFRTRLFSLFLSYSDCYASCVGWKFCEGDLVYTKSISADEIGTEFVSSAAFFIAAHYVDDRTRRKSLITIPLQWSMQEFSKFLSQKKFSFLTKIYVWKKIRKTININKKSSIE